MTKIKNLGKYCICNESQDTYIECICESGAFYYNKCCLQFKAEKI